VQLRHSWYGVTALVLLPEVLLSHGQEPAFQRPTLFTPQLGNGGNGGGNGGGKEGGGSSGGSSGSGTTRRDRGDVYLPLRRHALRLDRTGHGEPPGAGEPAE
jgi:hypothetical protein